MSSVTALITDMDTGIIDIFRAVLKFSANLIDTVSLLIVLKRNTVNVEVSQCRENTMLNNISVIDFSI
jgi:hypothetical protein